MAEAIVSFLLEKLGDFVLQEAKSFSKVDNYEKIRHLERELKDMQFFLKDADGKQDQDERVRLKVAEIRDLAYDADDILERHEDLYTASKNKGRLKRIGFWGESKTLQQLGSEIDEITGRVTKLITTLEAYDIKRLKSGNGSSNSSKEKQRRQLRRTFSHVVERDIVGLEEQTQELLVPLLGNERNLHVVAICGMGGLGKTTLAKMVYHHRKVRCHFKRFAWACISQQWDVREVWEGILIRLTSPNADGRDRISKLKDDELAKELYQVQLKTKCLVVLDDIWKENAWDSLSAGFPVGNATGSKILLTSRNIEVAQHVDPKGFIHKPRYLNESESWELFVRTSVFGREGTGFVFNKCLEEIGMEMLKHCGGLPLAIKVLGGIMATKYTIDEWKRVYDDVKIHLRGKDQVKEVFGLSYNDLPFHLKPCFLHFSHYGEDNIVSAKRLIEIWLAEGFVPSNRGDEERKEMEDIAEENLEQLVLRCMVQIETRSLTGRIKTCKIHDIMRDLCIHQAKKEGFVHFLQNGYYSTSPVEEKVHRLTFHYLPGEGVEYRSYAHIRSLISHLTTRCSEIVDFMLNKFKLLRVLILTNVRCQIPEGIGELIHLRLLDLTSACILGHIPSSIGNLSRLLTVRLQTCTYDHLGGTKTQEVPDVIVKLKRLRHLYLPWSISAQSGELKLANLSSLQTLVNYPEFSDPSDILTFSSLKKFKMSSSSLYMTAKWKEVFHFSSGNRFDNLQSLSMRITSSEMIDVKEVGLCCPNLRKLKVSMRICSLEMDPNMDNHVHFLQNLAKLTLKYSDLSKDPMPFLGQLPNLTILVLHNAVECGTIVCPANGFQRLESLVLEYLPQLGEWVVEEGALQCLRRLEISSCRTPKAMPEGLIFINGLRELVIRRMRQEFADRVRRGGEDFHIIQHVPLITINGEVVGSIPTSNAK